MLGIFGDISLLQVRGKDEQRWEMIQKKKLWGNPSLHMGRIYSTSQRTFQNDKGRGEEDSGRSHPGGSESVLSE